MRVNVLVFFLLVTILSCQFKKSQERFLIGFSQPTIDDLWRQTMIREMERELSFHPDLHMEYRDAKNDNNTQIGQIKELISLGIDLLIVSPNESLPLTSTIEQVYNSGIPVIIIDRKINSNRYTSYIGADNYEIGKIAGDYAAIILEGKGKVFEIWGLTGSSPAIERHDGFVQAIENYPELSIDGKIEGAWQKQIASEHLENSKTNLDSFDLIFAHNDAMGVAAREYLKKKKFSSCLVFGVDGLAGPEGGIQLVMDGVLDATFLYPTGGEEAIRTAVAILNNQSYQKENILETSIVDDENVRLMKLQGDKILNQQATIERQVGLINNQLKHLQDQRLITIILSLLTMMLIALAIIVFYQLRAKQKINRKLQVQNAQILENRNEIEEMAQKAELANKEKVEFFTNISHEFKTPLTLIMSPIDDLLKRTDQFKKDDQNLLLLVRKNSQRLLRLVEQLMDFRKIENDKMKVQFQKTEMLGFLSEIMESFKIFAEEKDIDFKLKSNLDEKEIWIDQNMIDKVFFNLLSNAFKFTQEKGRIHLNLSEDKDGNMIFRISDNGRGMSKEHAAHAFERFYQGEQYATKGTGLGLSLSKKFIEIHAGTIEVESEKGVGTTFTIVLPENRQDEEPPVIKKNIETKYPDIAIYSNDFESIPAEVDISKEKTILLIEDNEDMNQYLTSRLIKKYNILRAFDGRTGVKIAIDEIPDLIITDLGLPELNGIELIQHLKNNVLTAHIPVIVLTAKTQNEAEAFKLGADDYITKPLDLTRLEQKIIAKFLNLEKLKTYYSSELKFDISRRKINLEERNFIENFKQCVLENYMDTTFQVEDICKALGVSRIQLYRKIKALTDISINEYIQQVRLNRAKELLTSSSLNISELAYQCGYNSSSYFSTAFKNHFNCSPSEYRTNH